MSGIVGLVLMGTGQLIEESSASWAWGYLPSMLQVLADCPIYVISAFYHA